VLESVRAGKQPSQWTAQELTAFAPEFQGNIAKLLSPSEGMKTREIMGGTGPDMVTTALAEAERRLATYKR
jgi:argininosuccinate lyase